MAISNDLWRKDGGVPAPIPYSEDDADGNRYDNLANNPAGQAALKYVKAPDYPNHDVNTKHCVWDTEIEFWVVADKPPEPVVPIKITHKEFLDLMTFEEIVLWKVKEKELAEMKANLFAINPLFQKFAVMKENFEKSLMIELNNPQTMYGVMNVMVPMGILATTQRAQQLLANIKPT